MTNVKFHYIVSKSALEKTKEFLKISQEEQSEVVILWSGEIKGNTVRIKTAWLPFQYTDVGFFMIPGDELFNLNRMIFESGERLVAQVHTHPNLAFHSDADSEFSVTSMEKGLSIVVPNFGATSVKSYSECAYLIYKEGKWVRLSPSEARHHIRYEV